jgi:F-type H+-transporting ATPase subunit a
VLATAIAAVIVIALAFFLRAKVTSTGVPGGYTAVLGSHHGQLRDQIETAIGMKIAPSYCRWPSAVRLHSCCELAVGAAGAVHHGTRRRTTSSQAAGSGIQLRAGARLFVFICYHAAGIWRRGIIGTP